MLASAENDWEEDSKGLPEMTECARCSNKNTTSALLSWPAVIGALVVLFLRSQASPDPLLYLAAAPFASCRENFQWALFQLADLCAATDRDRLAFLPCSSESSSHHTSGPARVPMMCQSTDAASARRWVDSVSTEDYVRFLKALLCCVARTPPWPPKELCARVGRERERIPLNPATPHSSSRPIPARG